jgi:hypothetical protein
LARTKQIGIDGTFKSCPTMFAQLYIIMAWCKGECMPVAFAFLGGKKETTYRRMVSELCNACKERQLEFRPLRILVDFEVGAIAAFKFSFPTSKVIGCFFHFGQCLFRKIVEVGLKKEYGEDEDLRSWFALCVSLAFIPRSEVETIYVETILDEAPLDKYPKLNGFIDYMTETWVDNGLFPLELWNHFKNTEERVNNSNESYNYRFNIRLGKELHPNIWKCVEVMQKEEFLMVQVRCAGLLSGTLKPKIKRNHDLERNVTILKAKNIFLQSHKYYDDLVTLLNECTSAIQNFQK